MIKKLIKDSLAYLPSMILPTLVGIIAMPVITRLFAPEAYGDYILVITTVSLLSALATAWIGSSAIRFYPVYEVTGELNKFYSVLLRMTIFSIGLISIIFLVVLLLLKNHISLGLLFLMRIGLLFFIVSSFAGFFLNLLRARRKVIQYSIFTIWGSVAGLIIGIAIILLMHANVEGLLWGDIICVVISLPFLWKTSFGASSLREGRILSKMTWDIAKYGIPAIMINILTWVQSLSDRYILGLFRGSAEMGIYSPSYTIAENGIFFITSLFLLSSEPIGFDVWEKHGVRESQNFMNKVTRYYLIVALPAAVGLSMLSKVIVHVLVAPQYYSGYLVIPLVAFGAFFVGLAHRFTTTLSYHKRNDLIMFCCLSSAVLGIVLNFILIPKYGYMAAAFSTFVSYFFLLILSIIVSRRFLKWRFPFKSFVKCSFASALMALAVYFLMKILYFSNFINMFLEIIAGVVIYSVLIFLLKEALPEEINAVKIFIKKLKIIKK